MVRSDARRRARSGDLESGRPRSRVLACERCSVPGTASRLERVCRVGQSLFDVYDYTVVSTDFIKADRRRTEFLQAAPVFVIVDEAHGCAFWDAFEWMGGKGASLAWYKRGLIVKDFQHPTTEGAELIGNALFAGLVR